MNRYTILGKNIAADLYAPWQITLEHNVMFCALTATKLIFFASNFSPFFDRVKTEVDCFQNTILLFFTALSF